MSLLLMLPALAQSAPSLQGTWEENKELSESADALLGKQGVPWPIRKLIEAGTATETITVSDSAIAVEVKVGGATRKIGGPTNGQPATDGDQDTWSWDGDVLVQEQVRTVDGHTHTLRVTRQVVGSDRMLVQMELRVDGALTHSVRQIYARV